MDIDTEKYEYFTPINRARRIGDDVWDSRDKCWREVGFLIRTDRDNYASIYRRLKTEDTPWKPKCGELVYVADYPSDLASRCRDGQQRVYLFTDGGLHYCVNLTDKRDWEEDRTFGVTPWLLIKQVEEDTEITEALDLVKKAEATLAEAKQKLEQKQKRG